LNKIYLNNAASSWPKAPGVAESVNQALLDYPFHPGRSSGAAADPLNECRFLIKELLGVSDNSSIVLTENATYALNIAILGTKLQKGDLVISTVMEHNSVLRPLYHLKEKNEIKIILVPCDEKCNLDMESYERALRDNPALVIINHASNVTGKVNDIEVLFSKAKQAGAVTLLDASQTMGSIPVNPIQLQADMVAFTGHKSLCGPPGTGGLYVNPAIKLAHSITGGTGVKSESLTHPEYMPTRLEAGTPNIPAFSGLATALKWLNNNAEKLHEKKKKLTQMLINNLTGISGLRVFGDFNSSGIVSFIINDWHVEEIGYILEQSFGILCRTGLHCAPLIHQSIGSFPDGTVRFSLSGFNTEEDIESATIAVRKMVA
jgi:cysteine desulfurase family protein